MTRYVEAFAADARPNGIIGTYGADFVERFCGRGAQLKGHTHNFGVLHDKQGEFKKVQEKKLPRPAAHALRTGRRRKSSSEAIETGSD